MICDRKIIDYIIQYQDRTTHEVRTSTGLTPAKEIWAILDELEKAYPNSRYWAIPANYEQL